MVLPHLHHMHWREGFPSIICTGGMSLISHNAMRLQVAYVASPVVRVNVRATIKSEGNDLVTNDFTVAFKVQRGQVPPPPLSLPYPSPLITPHMRSCPWKQ